MNRLKISICLILCIQMIFAPIVVTYASTSSNIVSTAVIGISKADGKVLQKKLKELGYYNGDINGVFGSSRTALNRFFEDKGVTNDNNRRLRALTSSNNWNDISYDIYKLVMNTDKKGISKIERTPNDYSLITAIKDCKAYTAAHGFKYCYCGAARVNLNKSERHYCSTHNISSSDRKYVTDCSTGVSAALFEYAKALGNEEMKNRFRSEVNRSAHYMEIGNKLKNGETDKHFILVKNIKNAQKGDILVSKGHVEFYAGVENGKIMVWNWGNNNAIASPGKTESNVAKTDVIRILRLKDSIATIY